MTISIDVNKAQQLAPKLYNKFRAGEVFNNAAMPEDAQPKEVEEGSVEHLIFITLTLALDYQRDADQLWNAGRITYEDPQTRYLFDLQQVHESPIETISNDMQKHALRKKIEKDPMIWKTICSSFCRYWDGSPEKFLTGCGWDSRGILKRLKDDGNLVDGKIERHFPHLRGDKIGPLWIRMLRDNVGCTQLTNLDKVPIPVDIHIARASLTLGLVRGSYSGSLNDLFREIRRVWFEGVKNQDLGHRQMCALDVDSALWTLSKYGCTNRLPDGRCPKMSECAFKKECTPGAVIIVKNKIELNT